MDIELERKERKKMYNVDRHTRVINVPQTSYFAVGRTLMFLSSL